MCKRSKVTGFRSGNRRTDGCNCSTLHANEVGNFMYWDKVRDLLMLYRPLRSTCRWWTRLWSRRQVVLHISSMLFTLQTHHYLLHRPALTPPTPGTAMPSSMYRQYFILGYQHDQWEKLKILLFKLTPWKVFNITQCEGEKFQLNLMDSLQIFGCKIVGSKSGIWDQTVCMLIFDW